MINIRQSAYIVLVLTFIGMAACLFLAPTDGTMRGLFYFSVMVPVAVCITHFGATVLLFLNLPGFTPKFKQAYIKLFAGISLLALASLQLPFVTALGVLKTSVWITSGMIVVPYLVAYVLMYMGTRSFARLFGVAGWPMSRLLLIMVGTILAVLVTFVPHPTGGSTSEMQFDGTLGFAMFQLVILAIAGIMSLQASKRASISYIEPIALVSWYFFLAVMGSVVLIGLSFALPDGLGISGYIGYAFQAVGGVLLLRAAVVFADIRAAEVAEVAGDGTEGASGDAVLIDINIYLAGLVSNAQAVNDILNRMRAITAKREPGAALSKPDKAVLLHVYRDLEDYLVNKEPVRRHSLEELHNLVEHALRKKLQHNAALWREVMSGS